MTDSTLREFEEGDTVTVTLEDGTRFESITVTARADYDASDQYQRSRTRLDFDGLDAAHLRRLPEERDAPLRITEETTRGGDRWQTPPEVEAVDDTDPMDPVFRSVGTAAQIAADE